jgi:thymidylate synthase ThyX
MKAFLVWDGGPEIMVPPQVGKPHSEQMKGTSGEQLIEVCTRLCYDSMGLDDEGQPKGRGTKDTLKNVMETGHHSVLEHYVRTVEFQHVPPGAREDIVLAFTNRPGCWLRWKLDVTGPVGDEVNIRVTMNVRAVVEWEEWSERLRTEHGFPAHGETPTLWRCIGYRLRTLWTALVPLLVEAHDVGDTWPVWLLHSPLAFAEPETDSEKWLTLYLVGSRGMSHEQVRHRFAMSQRSTRYCEEGESAWHWHPLIHKFIEEHPHVPVFADVLRGAQHAAQETYRAICDELQEWLAAKLPKETPYRKKHARKQARGAARGFLGNALETQMCFTAPVWGWRHIASMRAADAADAEIRVVISEAVRCLKASRYGDRFADLVLGPASDGMGEALVGGGHK